MLDRAFRVGTRCLMRTAAYNGVFTPEQDNDKTTVEPVHSYYPFHTRHVGPGVKAEEDIFYRQHAVKQPLAMKMALDADRA